MNPAAFEESNEPIGPLVAADGGRHLGSESRRVVREFGVHPVEKTTNKASTDNRP